LVQAGLCKKLDPISKKKKKKNQSQKDWKCGSEIEHLSSDALSSKSSTNKLKKLKLGSRFEISKTNPEFPLKNIIFKYLQNTGVCHIFT
jgi:hypothetical protein